MIIKSDTMDHSTIQTNLLNDLERTRSDLLFHLEDSKWTL